MSNPYEGMSVEELKADLLRQAEFVDEEYKKADEYIEGGYDSPLSGSAKGQLVDQRAALAKYQRCIQKRLSTMESIVPPDDATITPFGIDTRKTNPRSASASE